MGEFAITLTSENNNDNDNKINRGWVCWGVAIGGQAMSLIFGSVYDAHADENGKCTQGQVCYVRAFYLNIITVSTAVVVALVFSFRKK